MILLIVRTTNSYAGQQNMSAKQSQFKLKEEAINRIYNSFLYEKTVCKKFVAAIAEDREFIENFEYLGSFEHFDTERETEYRQRISERLSKSKAAKNNVVQYVQNHIGYFIVDEDFHGLPEMTYVKNSPVFCMQTDRRLKELEAFPPSVQSWKVREYFLNISLEKLLAIGMPWSEGPIGYNFESLRTQVEITKRRYLPKFKEPFKNWALKAAMRLREKTNSKYPIPKNQLSEVQKWVTELKKGLE